MLLVAGGGQGRTLSETDDFRLHEHVAGCEACQALMRTNARLHQVARSFQEPLDDAPDRIVLPTVDPSVFTKGEVLARGGMGRITRARDRRLGRDVAIKEVLAPELRARFEREAMITARLQHPAIVPIYEAGMWPDGSPFYTMRLVAGGTLSDAMDKAGTLEERLALLPHVIAVTEALGYAHARRVVHRDLKPANVLVDEFGETVVIDWGLAKELERAATEDDSSDGMPAAPDLTRVGSVVGTPCFIAPEQAAGDEIDERADVYALGAILYQLLAGHPPYWDGVEHSADQLVAAARKHPPTPIGELAPRAPVDLRAIVERAMARDKAARFPTAKEMAEELRRFETGQLLRSREYRLRELLVRRLRQHRAAVTVGAVAVCVLAIVGVVSVQKIVARDHEVEQMHAVKELKSAEAHSATLEAQHVAKEAQHVAKEAQRVVAEAQIERGRQLVIDGDLEQGVAYLAAGLKTLPDDPVALRLATIALRDVHRWLGSIPGTASAFRSDGRQLAIGQANGAITTIDPRETDPMARKNQHTLTCRGGPSMEITMLAYPSKGSMSPWLAVASKDGAYLCNTQTGEGKRLLADRASEVLFLPGGDHIAIVSGNAVSLVGLDGKRRVLADGLEWPHALAVSRDAANFLVVTWRGVIAWRVADFARIPEEVAVEGRRFSATLDHGRMITGGMDGVRQWVTRNQSKQLSPDFAGGLSWIDDHTLLADGSIIRTDTGQILPLGHSSIQVSAIIPNNKCNRTHVITGGFDHTLRIWDVERPTHPLVVLDAADTTDTLSVDPTGQRAVSHSSAADAGVELWDVASVCAEVQTAKVDGPVDNLLSDHRDRVAVQVGEKTTLVSSTLQRNASIDGYPITFRPGADQADQIVTGHTAREHYGVLSVYASSDGTLRREIPCPDKGDNVWSIAFSPDGKASVISCERSVWLRDADGADWRVVTRSAQSLRISRLALDGHDHVVTGHDDGTLRIWDASSGSVTGQASASGDGGSPRNLLSTLIGHTANIVILEIRGDTLLSTSWDGTLRLWKFPSGEAHDRVFKSFEHAAISPDQQWIATVDGSAMVSVWDGKKDRLIEQIPTAEALRRVVFVDDHHLVVGGKYGRLELIDLSERLLTADEVKHLVDGLPRWQVAGGQVVVRNKIRGSTP
jgi:WD40 repeat protein/tRNA A-37 threonylcarbamoyl transferase component Bud32